LVAAGRHLASPCPALFREAVAAEQEEEEELEVIEGLEAILEAQEIPQQLGVPLSEATELVVDDRINYKPEEGAGEEEEEEDARALVPFFQGQQLMCIWRPLLSCTQNSELTAPTTIHTLVALALLAFFRHSLLRETRMTARHSRIVQRGQLGEATPMRSFCTCREWFSMKLLCVYR
jgi:hypothetical protein